MGLSNKLGRNYSWAACVSLAFQGCSFVLLLLFLGATMKALFLSAFLLYWTGFLAVVLPRPQAESPTRLLYVALGFPGCLVVAGVFWHYLE